MADKITLSNKSKSLPERRTAQQNKALWLYAQQCADALNDAGFSIQEVLTKHTTVEMPWTKEAFMDILWRTVQVRLLGKRSTTELSKQQDIDMVYDVVNRFLGERLHIHVPFPSYEPGHHDTAPMFDASRDQSQQTSPTPPEPLTH